MSTVELKNKIFGKLDEVNDDVLRYVLELLEFETNSGKYQLSKAEKEAIDIGLKEIENGQTIPHEDVVKEINEWLNK